MTGGGAYDNTNIPGCFAYFSGRNDTRFSSPDITRVTAMGVLLGI